MSCLAGASGWCFGYSLLKNKTHIIIPILCMLFIFLGVALVNYVHAMEIGHIRNTTTQVYQPYICVFESYGRCVETTSKLTQQSYSHFMSGAAKSFTAYIPITLMDEIKNNIGTYFIIGIILAWLTNVGVEKLGKTKAK